MLRFAVVIGITFLLGACLPVDEFTQQKNAARQAGAVQAHKMAASPAEVQKFLSNTTAKVWNMHGTQIEYLAADGRTFLWYPGNAKVLPGRWKLQKASYGLEMCFLYGEATYNPITLQRGGNWECDMAAYYLLDRDELVAGDPLRLERITVPFVMPKGSNVSIAQAMSKAGFGKLRAANKALAPQYPTGN